MKTRNKVLATLVLGTVLSTSLFAKGGMFDDDDNMRNQNCPMGMMKDGKNDRGERGFHREHKDPFFGILRQLNLTDDQEAKVKEIFVEGRKNIKTTDEAFTKNGFDKNKYIELMNQKRENMLKSKADMIEKIYAILTPAQKEQVKVLMDLEKEKMQNLFKSEPKDKK